jgi:alkaline phosphatase
VYVRNAAEVRRVLEADGRVLAVFQGHHHEGGCRCVGGIPYYTLKALVAGKDTAYATVRVMRDGSLTVTGFGRAESRRLAREDPS